MSTDRIFVSIAAYREFDLVHTVRDAFANAAAPDRLRFCICWQHADDESLDGLERDPRVQLIDVPYRESLGVCWARNAIQQRYRGEAYYLQLDGHHRFAAHWDDRLVAMLEGLRRSGSHKPILTSYLPSFDPNNDPAGRNASLWLLGLDRFETSGVVFMRPYTPSTPPDAPVPCRFWSAHFSFSDGRFNEEVIIDPHGYFHAEEIGTGVRAWTHGYDFFNPHETLLWHEYSRRGRICHWDDHSDWGRRNAAAIARYRSLFGLDGTPRRDLGPYGFGSHRSFRDYERFAGISFDRRGVEPHTIAHGVPPGPLRGVADAQWRENLLMSHSLDVRVDRDLLIDDDPSLFVGVFANAADGTELYREDYPQSRIQKMLETQPGSSVCFLVSFFSDKQPVTWTVWPCCSTKGWMKRVDGQWHAPTGPNLPRESDLISERAALAEAAGGR